MKQIAIKVENKRQFDALMKHYDEKGWESWSGVRPKKHVDISPNVILYSDEFNFDKHVFFSEDYTIIDFDTFSLLTGVKVADGIELKFSQLVTGKVTKDRIDFYANGENHAISFLDKKDIEEIYTAINSLQ